MSESIGGVTPGVLDDAMRRLLMWGQCLALAIAISERTGWPLVEVRGERDGRKGFHVGVELPDGRVLDAEGAHDRADWLATYGAVSCHRVDYEPRGTPEARRVMALAQSVAGQVLRLAGDLPAPTRSRVR